EFWTSFTNASQVYSIGEGASNSTAYVGACQGYADGVLHYPLYYILMDVFRDQNPQSMEKLAQQVKVNNESFNDTTLCDIFLDNHDLPRFLNQTKNELLIRNALIYLMFSDGTPVLYYGTEQGFIGNNSNQTLRLGEP
ncbi:unnamed protein product, partial [Rotaria sordida]